MLKDIHLKDYRGFCPEFINSCGYSKTSKFQEDLEAYRNTDYENREAKELDNKK